MEERVDFASLLGRLVDALNGAGPRDTRLQRICDLLRSAVPHYQWVGFYVADEAKRVLRLGPFSGADTEHRVIPYGRGICGQVAVDPRTFEVPDVTLQDNYLSCSLDVRSEIVVPVMVGGRFVAQLDIDSHEVAPFSAADRSFLESICEEVARLWEVADER